MTIYDDKIQDNHIYTLEEKKEIFKKWKDTALDFYNTKMYDKEAISRIKLLNFNNIKDKIDCDYLLNAIERFKIYKPEIIQRPLLFENTKNSEVKEVKKKQQ